MDLWAVLSPPPTASQSPSEVFLGFFFQLKPTSVDLLMTKIKPSISFALPLCHVSSGKRAQSRFTVAVPAVGKALICEEGSQFSGMHPSLGPRGWLLFILWHTMK